MYDAGHFFKPGNALRFRVKFYRGSRAIEGLFESANGLILSTAASHPLVHWVGILLRKYIDFLLQNTCFIVPVEGWG